jgi:colanic acid biosynthesis glycosyl transferase WcaI
MTGSLNSKMVAGREWSVGYDVQSPYHVLFLNRVFPPDTGATGQYLNSLARALAERGWRISIVTAKTVGGPDATPKAIRVWRVRGLPFRRKPVLYRALAYLSLYPALLRGIGYAGRPDVMVIMTDPPLFLCLATLYAKWRQIPIIHWSQDVYPETAFGLGVMKENSILGRSLARLRTRALNRCTSVIAIGGCMFHSLRSKTSATITIMPNWAELELIHPLPQNLNPFRAKLLSEPTGQIVMYSGNFGLAHPFDAILTAISELQADRPDVRFAMLGAGPRLTDVKAEVERRSLKNVVFLPPQDYLNLSHTLSAADMHLASMEPSLLGLIVPSKVYGILAAGRPCIFLGPKECEVAVVIANAGAGEVLPPGRQHELGARLRAWLDDKTAREKAGENARTAAEQNSLAQRVVAFETVLRNAVIEICQPDPP